MPLYNGKRPPCPGNPETYILVKTKEGSYWRRKRGTKKKAVLNATLEKNANLTRITNEAASRIMRKLREYLVRMDKGRSSVRIAGKLKQAYNRKGIIDFSLLEGFDFQQRYPCNKLLLTPPIITQTGDTVEARIPIGFETVKKHSRLVTHYFLELILLHGNATIDHGLRDECVSSDVYNIDSDERENCVLALQVPEQPWMILMKVNCIEGNEMAASAKNYGIKILKTGGSLKD